MTLGDENTDVEGDNLDVGRLLDATPGGTAIVAPSITAAFDTIQGAIDAGYRHVILAEDITENEITIPRTFNPTGFRLEGVADGMYPTITDPEEGLPIIQAEQDDSDDINRRVNIRNIRFYGDTNAGVAILAAKNIDNTTGPWNAAGGWHLENIRVRGGPIIMAGPRNLLTNVEVAMWSENEFSIPNTDDDQGNPLTDKMAGVFRGTTFGQHGGTMSAKQDARTSAYYAVGGASITGGITYSNANPGGVYDGPGATTNVTFSGTSRAFIGGISTEGGVDYDVKFGAEEEGDEPGPGIEDALFAGPSAFDTLLINESSNNVEINNPVGNVSINKQDYSNLVVKTDNDVTVESGSFLPNEITHIKPSGQVYRLGGNRDSPTSQFAIQIATGAPNYPREAGMLIADGTNWDPTGNSGNAAFVIYNGSSWVRIVDLGAPL